MTIRETTSPFKEICQHCNRRKNVRLYPYNEFEWLGVLCPECFNFIDRQISDIVGGYGY